MSNTQRSSGVRVSFEMMARTSCVMDPVSSHSETRPSCSSSTAARSLETLTLYLFQYPVSPLIKMAGETGRKKYELIEIRLERGVLSDQHSLAIFLDHLEVI